MASVLSLAEPVDDNLVDLVGITTCKLTLHGRCFGLVSPNRDGLPTPLDQVEFKKPTVTPTAERGIPDTSMPDIIAARRVRTVWTTRP